MLDNRLLPSVPKLLIKSILGKDKLLLFLWVKLYEIKGKRLYTSCCKMLHIASKMVGAHVVFTANS